MISSLFKLFAFETWSVAFKIICPLSRRCRCFQILKVVSSLFEYYRRVHVFQFIKLFFSLYRRVFNLSRPFSICLVGFHTISSRFKLFRRNSTSIVAFQIVSSLFKLYHRFLSCIVAFTLLYLYRWFIRFVVAFQDIWSILKDVVFQDISSLFKGYRLFQYLSSLVKLLLGAIHFPVTTCYRVAFHIITLLFEQHCRFKTCHRYSIYIVAFYIVNRRF